MAPDHSTPVSIFIVDGNEYHRQLVAELGEAERAGDRKRATQIMQTWEDYLSENVR